MGARQPSVGLLQQAGRPVQLAGFAPCWDARLLFSSRWPLKGFGAVSSATTSRFRPMHPFQPRSILRTNAGSAQFRRMTFSEDK